MSNSKRFAPEHETNLARKILAKCGVEIGTDFYILSSSQVSRLLEYADTCKYRKPANANGSRGRYWHDRLQRLAQRVTISDAFPNLAGKVYSAK